MKISDAQKEQIKHNVRLALQQLMPQLPAAQAHYWVVRMFFFREISERATSLVPDDDKLHVPEQANFWCLHAERHRPENDLRLSDAFEAIEQENLNLQGALVALSCRTEAFGNPEQNNQVLGQLLTIFGHACFNLADALRKEPHLEHDLMAVLTRIMAEEYNDKGNHFYTPYEISYFLSALLQPQVGERVLDPTCGCALSLIACSEYLKAQEGKADVELTLCGQEKDPLYAAMAKLNLTLAGYGFDQLACEDSIISPLHLDPKQALQSFEVVLGHPPFAETEWGYEAVQNDKHQRFTLGMPPKTRGDYAYLLHMLAFMKADVGRMALLMPHGVLFRAANEREIRQALLKQNKIDAIISLPEKLIPQLKMPLVILILRQKKQHQDVFFIQAERFMTPGKTLNRMHSKHMRQLLEAYTKRADVPGFCRCVDMETIIEHDYNLNVGLYFGAQDSPLSIEQATQNLVDEQVKLKALQENIASMIIKLVPD
jgi:type I restriction enzyme M protein